MAKSLWLTFLAHLVYKYSCGYRTGQSHNGSESTNGKTKSCQLIWRTLIRTHLIGQQQQRFVGCRDDQSQQSSSPLLVTQPIMAPVLRPSAILVGSFSPPLVSFTVGQLVPTSQFMNNIWYYSSFECLIIVNWWEFYKNQPVTSEH